jgi:hypothetical protein
MAKRKDAALILTHGRPANVMTVRALRDYGYTGLVYLVVDNLDPTLPEYIERYGDQVVVFDKPEAARQTDSGDNLGTMRGVVYARNASFALAEKLGLPHFIQLDDDYRQFRFRFDDQLIYRPTNIRNLDRVFAAFYEFLDTSGADCVAMAQGGDFIGGPLGSFAKSIRLRRKLMNSFFCRVDRPFQFLGRINEDTTLYVDGGAKGRLFFTANQVCLEQLITQSNPGGLTEIYLDAGTYVKSFYSVMYQPSSVKVSVLRGQSGTRLHHQVSWRQTTPMILRESWRKASR